ncbi:MAG TPA: PKD domain-containing protein, partial [Flavobacteriales bacterium]|nr:PKD domain-containing protein [Flavobacteriales bacterium]
MLKQQPELSVKWLRSILAAVTFATSFSHITAQSFSIADGSITTCAGVMNDNGGPGSDYTNNENFTVVICPDNPGDGISLFWSVFTLSTVGTNANMDRIRIWDGDNTSANFLGEYTGTQLQGLITSSTTFNPTGCLTIQFLSNNSGVGNFAAGITCYTPCEHPTAVAVMGEAVPALICQGEEVSFDGSASFAAAGFNIVSYMWDFDDGTTGTGPTTSHIFDIPGEYIVQLNLLDDNNCVNSNVVDLQILVSTTPSFNGSTESYSVCLGAQVDVAAVATPVTWTGLPETNFGDGVYLPDDLGSPFSSSVTFTQFGAGQLLTNANDLLSICVSMEHSFMGDLVLSVTCPNGQVIILHQQGGGGTFIGDANDGDSNANPIPGTCWDYCWSPNATNGTFSECSQFGVTPNVMPSSQGTALAPGTYSAVQPWTNLQGCPLNGTWTYTSVDNWAADNGFICSWQLNFNPAIIPPVTQFTPDLGTVTADSAYWVGPNLVNDPNNTLLGSATLDTPGSYPYQFFVTDNFGCMYDTTIFVTVAQPIALDAGPNIQLCSTPVPMAAQVVANPPPTPCIWTLTLSDGGSDTWNGASVELIVDGVSAYYTLNSWGIPQQVFNIPVISGQSIQIDYTQSTWDNSDVSFLLADDQGGAVYQSQMGPSAGTLYQGQAACPGTPPAVTWEWSPSAGLTDATSPNSDVFLTQQTWYHLTVYPIGFPECAVTDSVLVSPDPSLDPGLSYTMIICQGEPVFLMTDSLGGTPNAGGVWTSSNGTVERAYYKAAAYP